MARIRGVACHCAPFALAGLASLLVGCGAGARDGSLPDGEMDVPVGAKGQPGRAQIARGAALFAEHCAECHGKGGQGSAEAPPVVGENALPMAPREGARLRKLPFRTADDVHAFVRIEMPLDAPAILGDDDYYAIVAFLLKSNGMDLEGKRVDESSAPTLLVHDADPTPEKQ